MKALQIINYIATHPEIEVVVIKSDDDRTPMQAIDYLSSMETTEDFCINTSLEKGTLLVY